MAVLLGQLPSNFSPPKDISPTLPQVPTGLPSELLARRPDLLSAEQQLRSAAIRVGLTKVEFLPKFTLVGNAGYGSLTEDNLLKEQASSMTMVHNSTSRFLATDYVKVYSDKPKQDIVRAPPSINQPSSTQYAKSTTPCWILKAILESSNSSFKRWSPPLCLLKRQKTDTTRGSLITLITLLPSKSAYKLLHARPH